MEKIETPSEAKVNVLLQLLAAMVERLGGEVVLGQEEFSAFEDVPVMMRNLTSGYIVLRLGFEDEIAEEPIVENDEPRPPKKT